MPKYRKISASLYGKTANIVPSENGINVYTTSTLLIVASLWVFAGLGFWISILFNNLVASVIITVISGIIGFLLAFKLYTGKLVDSFSYADIACIKYSAPELTIINHENYLYSLRVLTNSSRKLIAAIAEQLNEHPDYQFTAKHGGYYIEPRKADKE